MKALNTLNNIIVALCAVTLALVACSKAEIRQAQVMTEAEIDAYNKEQPAPDPDPVDPEPTPDPGPSPIDPDPVNPDQPAPSDARITDGSVYFVRPTALGLADGSSWNNALGVDGLRHLIAQKLNGEGQQDDTRAFAQAAKLDGVKIYLSEGKFLLATADTTVVKMEWSGYTKPVKVSFFGGYAGNSGGVDLTQRNLNSHITMLTGDANGNNAVDDNDYRVLLLGNQTDVEMDGITFAYCYRGNGNGGALEASSGKGEASFTLTNCIFRDNMANNDSSSGGAIQISNGTVNATNCRFSNNTGRNGGAIAMGSDRAVLNVSNSTLEQNDVANCGAVLNLSKGKATFETCTFKNNRSNGYGGGVAHVNGEGTQLICKTCNFTSNEAVCHGGAISIENGTVTLQNCTLSSNRSAINKVNSSKEGGTVTLLLNNSFLNLSGCNFKNNESMGVGGALAGFAGRIFADNCRFEGNKSNNRGVIRLLKGLFYFNRCSIFDSTVSGQWGVALQLSSVGAVCMNNVTIARNSGSNKDSASLNGSGNALIVNSTLADGGQLGTLRAEGGSYTFAFLNSILLHDNAKNAVVYGDSGATVQSLGSCISGKVSGADGGEKKFISGTGDKLGSSFGALGLSWDSTSALYSWNGIMDGQTKIDPSTIANIVKTQFPISVTGKLDDGTEVFKVDNVGKDFYNWVTGISSTAFTTDAIGTSRGSSATCGAYQAN
ncbi:MAG: hypothetical protein IJU13_04090 [Bacteroidales bacterium]|nr:hypothetical protein [Bacteroidales bacterium]